MIDIQKHIISRKATVLNALNQLNHIPYNLTLLATDENKRLIGTLTDGDIRRGLTQGISLDNSILSILPKNYISIQEQFEYGIIRKSKEKGIKLLPQLNEDKTIKRVFDLQKCISVLPLEAVIMAGGKGMRLRPLTENTPKPMLKIGAKPILEHLIDRLIQFGIYQIHISVNYLGDQIKQYFGTGESKGIQINYIDESRPLGTIGAVGGKKFNKDLVLLNSDLFTSIDYEDLYTEFERRQPAIAVSTLPYTVNVPYAIVEDENGTVTDFREKPTYNYFANAGIYLIKKKTLSRIPENTFYNTTDLMEDLLKSKFEVMHRPIIGYWIDIGRHEDYLRAQEIQKYLE